MVPLELVKAKWSYQILDGEVLASGSERLCELAMERTQQRRLQVRTQVFYWPKVPRSHDCKQSVIVSKMKFEAAGQQFAFLIAWLV